jgi:hypothetical protein
MQIAPTTKLSRSSVLHAHCNSASFFSTVNFQDRIVNLGKNPIKSFIAAQVAFQPDEKELRPYFVEPSKSVVPSSSRVASTAAAFTSRLSSEDDWVRYITDKYKLNLNAENLKNEVVDYSTLSLPASPIFAALNGGKRKMSKRAIVQRIATPTFSSLAKRKEKV